MGTKFVGLLTILVTIRSTSADSAVLAADCQLLTNLTDIGAWRYIRIDKQVFYVFCDGNGYTYLFHQIFNGLPLRNSWEEFKVGVNLGHTAFWAGNELLYRLTNNGLYNQVQIRVLRADLYQNMYYNGMGYGFRVAAEQYDYKMSVERVVGPDLAAWLLQFPADTSPRSLSPDGMKFTTVDRCNDLCGNGNCATLYGAWWSSCCGTFASGAPNSRSAGSPYIWNAYNSSPQAYFLNDALFRLKVTLPDPSLATLGNRQDTFRFTGASIATASGYAAVSVLTDNDPSSCVLLSDTAKPLLYIAQYRNRYPFIGAAVLVLQGARLSNLNVTAAWGIGLGSAGPRIDFAAVQPVNDTQVLLRASQFCQFWNRCDQLFASLTPLVNGAQSAVKLCEMFIDPCSAKTNLCENNSTCVSASRTQYTCVCPTGYQGQWCEQRLCTPGYKAANCLTAG